MAMGTKTSCCTDRRLNCIKITFGILSILSMLTVVIFYTAGAETVCEPAKLSAVAVTSIFGTAGLMAHGCTGSISTDGKFGRENLYYIFGILGFFLVIAAPVLFMFTNNLGIVVPDIGLAIIGGSAFIFLLFPIVWGSYQRARFQSVEDSTEEQSAKNNTPMVSDIIIPIEMKIGSEEKDDDNMTNDGATAIEMKIGSEEKDDDNMTNDGATNMMNGPIRIATERKTLTVFPPVWDENQPDSLDSEDDAKIEKQRKFEALEKSIQKKKAILPDLATAASGSDEQKMYDNLIKKRIPEDEAKLERLRLSLAGIHRRLETNRMQQRLKHLL